MNRGPGSVFYRPIRGLGNACTDPQLTLWAIIRRHSVADWISIGQMLISMVQMSKLQSKPAGLPYHRFGRAALLRRPIPSPEETDIAALAG